jgi:hypothetical protein
VKLGFPVFSLSRPVLQLLGRYLPFPCEKTIHRWFHTPKEQVIRQLTHLDQIDEQIQLFMKAINLPPNSVASLVVNVIAMNPDRSHLPSKGFEHTFVIFSQQLDRQYRCLHVHIKSHGSGQATPDVWNAIKMVADVLSKPNLIVKDQCVDGDKGHNQIHLWFLNE